MAVDPSGINVLWPQIDNRHYKEALIDAMEGGCPNNISTILTYSLTGEADIMWMGDLGAGFAGSIRFDVDLAPVHILFAPHHGRDTGRVPESWLDKIMPKLIIVGEAPSEHLHYYPRIQHHHAEFGWRQYV